MQRNRDLGVIRSEELYSKQELLRRMKISQKTWDELLHSGLQFLQIGKAKWVRGKDLLEYFDHRTGEQTKSA